MDNLDVWSACTYPGTHLDRGLFTQDTWHAQKFVFAIKGKHINGWAEIPIHGERKQLAQANADDAFAWFGLMAEGHFATPSDTVLFVPVPPSHGVTEEGATEWRTSRVATSLAATKVFPNSRVVTALTWASPLTKATEGGPRDSETIRRNCAWKPLPATKHVTVLVDDVKTTGGHLAGCAAAMRDRFNELPIAAICVARTIESPTKDAFEWVVEQIPVP